MPFKSAKQRAWAHTVQGEKALGGPGAVQEWDQASKGMKLPEYVHPKAPHPAAEHWAKLKEYLKPKKV